MGEWDHPTWIIPVQLKHQRIPAFRKKKKRAPPTIAAPWCLQHYAMQVIEGMFVFKRVSKPSVVKKIPGVIINHLKCLQFHKTGIVENFCVSFHIFFQRSGRRKSFQFVLQTCNFHVRVMSLIMSLRSTQQNLPPLQHLLKGKIKFCSSCNNQRIFIFKRKTKSSGQGI